MFLATVSLINVSINVSLINETDLLCKYLIRFISVNMSESICALYDSIKVFFLYI